MNKSSFDPTNAVCGAFFILVGALFAWQSLQVELGTWLRIGPGGMPLAPDSVGPNTPSVSHGTLVSSALARRSSVVRDGE